MAIDDKKFQKNAEIIRKYMAKEVKGILKNTGKFIRENMPTLEAGYQLLVGPQEEERSRAQIELILKCAREYLENSNLDELIENNFKQYMKNDTLGYNMRRRHKRSQEAMDLLKSMFKTQVESFSELLTGEGETYDELTLSVSPTYEKGLIGVEKIIEFSNKIVKIIKEDRGIIAAPGVVRYDIMLAVVNLVEYTNKRLMEELNRIYGREY
ncbi:MAG: hypothetical protein ACTSO9_17740 [Candidatus Helarchaeota archaeon]